LQLQLIARPVSLFSKCSLRISRSLRMDSLSAGTLASLVKASASVMLPGASTLATPAYPIIRSGVIDFDRNR